MSLFHVSIPSFHQVMAVDVFKLLSMKAIDLRHSLFSACGEVRIERFIINSKPQDTASLFPSSPNHAK